MVCALCELTPGLVQAEAARFCPAVLLSIDDTDPVVLPPVWEAVLHVVSTIPVSYMSWSLSASTHSYSRFVGDAFLLIHFIKLHLILHFSVPISRTAGHM